MSSRKLDVVVLMGGASSEREVSLVSGRIVMEHIDRERFDVRAVELGPVGPGAGLLQAAAAVSATSGAAVPRATVDSPAVIAAREILGGGGRLPDIVFIALHGRFGEDGCIQGLLELLGVPYTGSGVLASALAMDKIATKRILESCGVPTPRWCQVTGASLREGAIPDVVSACGLPAVVKPNREGSTIGTSIVESEQQLLPAIEEALRHDSVALCEEFVKGTEITVSVLGRQDVELLPIVEICPKGGFYDYEAKYTAGMTEEIVPARISEELTRHAWDLAAKTHKAIGCSGMSRVDMIVAPDNPGIERGITVLEVNTIPGMTPTSLLPRAAQAAGIAFTQVISRIIDYGLEEGAR